MTGKTETEKNKWNREHPYARIRAGSGIYTCENCGKRTRDVIGYHGNRQCKDCTDAGEHLNAIYDNDGTHEKIFGIKADKCEICLRDQNCMAEAKAREKVV